MPDYIRSLFKWPPFYTFLRENVFLDVRKIENIQISQLPENCHSNGLKTLNIKLWQLFLCCDFYKKPVAFPVKNVSICDFQSEKAHRKCVCLVNILDSM